MFCHFDIFYLHLRQYMYTDIQVEYVYMIHPVFNNMLLLAFLNWFNAHLRTILLSTKYFRSKGYIKQNL